MTFNVGLHGNHGGFNVQLGSDEAKILAAEQFKTAKMEEAAKQHQLQRIIEGKDNSTVVPTRTSLPGNNGDLGSVTAQAATNLANQAVKEGDQGVKSADYAAAESTKQMAQVTQIQMAATNAAAIIAMIAKFAEAVSKKVKGTGDSVNQMA